MGNGSGLVLVALMLFAAKHFIADFLLQNAWMQHGKGAYGHPAGLTHAAIHMVGSLPALGVLALSPIAAGLLILGEGIVHYHIDWAKETMSKRLGLGPGQTGFWALFGADQFLHQMTYLGMIAIALGVLA